MAQVIDGRLGRLQAMMAQALRRAASVVQRWDVASAAFLGRSCVVPACCRTILWEESGRGHARLHLWENPHGVPTIPPPWVQHRWPDGRVADAVTRCGVALVSLRRPSSAEFGAWQELARPDRDPSRGYADTPSWICPVCAPFSSAHEECAQLHALLPDAIREVLTNGLADAARGVAGDVLDDTYRRLLLECAADLAVNDIDGVLRRLYDECEELRAEYLQSPWLMWPRRTLSRSDWRMLLAAELPSAPDDQPGMGGQRSAGRIRDRLGRLLDTRAQRQRRGEPDRRERLMLDIGLMMPALDTLAAGSAQSAGDLVDAVVAVACDATYDDRHRSDGLATAVDGVQTLRDACSRFGCAAPNGAERQVVVAGRDVVRKLVVQSVVEQFRPVDDALIVAAARDAHVSCAVAQAASAAVDGGEQLIERIVGQAAYAAFRERHGRDLGGVLTADFWASEARSTRDHRRHHDPPSSLEQRVRAALGGVSIEDERRHRRRGGKPSWQEHFDAVSAYYTAHGTLPNRNVITDDGTNIGSWLRNQQSAVRGTSTHTITDDCCARLDDLCRGWADYKPGHGPPPPRPPDPSRPPPGPPRLRLVSPGDDEARPT